MVALQHNGNVIICGTFKDQLFVSAIYCKSTFESSNEVVVFQHNGRVIICGGSRVHNA